MFEIKLNDCFLGHPGIMSYGALRTMLVLKVKKKGATIKGGRAPAIDVGKSSPVEIIRDSLSQSIFAGGLARTTHRTL